MAQLRQRKVINAIKTPECPPKTVKKVAHTVWCACNTRNIIITIIALFIIFGIQNQESISQLWNKLIENTQSMDNTPTCIPINTYLGNFHMDIVTSDMNAQKYFDQTMILAAAFNHDEALRSAFCALKYDPKCVMCHWSIAYNYGFNINRLTDEDRLALSIKHAHLAKTYSDEMKQPPIIQDLVDTMLFRFPKDRTFEDEHPPFEEIYAKEFQKLTVKYSDNAIIQSLYAESLFVIYSIHVIIFDQTNET